uniref:Plethodontid modulating factor n=1 Tax=Timema tahoe TaxID=61484 RepID=A0A7R9FGT1_9NEOP|nr:unnamed protein product [Timema tahoe]
MKVVLFSVLFLAGLVTMSSANHCNFVCAEVQCENVKVEDCDEQGGQFHPKGSSPEIYPCVCCDTCTVNFSKESTI